MTSGHALLGVGLVAGALALVVVPWSSGASAPQGPRDVDTMEVREAGAMTEPAAPHLTPEQRRVLLEGGTEHPYSGQYWDEKKPGDYHCAACGNLLFHSDTKFDSGTGWPSYWEPATPTSVTLHEDPSLRGAPRVEVRCGKCGGHLGHVFKDSPQTPTGTRFCINSAALDLQEKGAAEVTFVPQVEGTKADAGKGGAAAGGRGAVPPRR